MPKHPALPVPLFYQPTEATCVPTCVKMVLAYYGLKASVGPLAKEMRTGALTAGTDLFDAGCRLLERGFDVRVCEWGHHEWGDALPNRFLRLPADEAAIELRRLCRRRMRKTPCVGRQSYAALLRFLDLGGVFEPRPATMAEIRQAVRRRQPPIVVIDCAVLWPVRYRQELHVVVPRSIDRRAIMVNDPYRAHGGRKSYPLDRFLFAMHKGGGGAMFIKPRR